MAVKLITFEGEARSGKGTSARAVCDVFTTASQTVIYIDQGQKFRAFARLALDRGVSLDDQLAVSAFLQDAGIRKELLQLLALVAKMEEPEVEALLYTQEISEGSAKIGMNAHSQQIIVDVLFDQVRDISKSGDTNMVIIDGRDMIVKARAMQDQGFATFILGFYFRCDAAIAARRTEGIFVDVEDMDADDRLRLLDTILKVSDRNRRDAMRSVHPLREPGNAYALHTIDFRSDDSEYVDAAARVAQASGAVSVDTSYTRNVEEMTAPVIALSKRVVELHQVS